MLLAATSPVGATNRPLPLTYPDSRAPQTPFAAVTDQKKTIWEDLAYGALQGAGVVGFVNQYPSDTTTPNANLPNTAPTLSTNTLLWLAIGAVVIFAVVKKG